jgi:hypothetical protein
MRPWAGCLGENGGGPESGPFSGSMKSRGWWIRFKGLVRSGGLLRVRAVGGLIMRNDGPPVSKP